jgi:hypothetical protein
VPISSTTNHDLALTHLVTTHAASLPLPRRQGVLDGDLDDFCDAYLMFAASMAAGGEPGRVERDDDSLGRAAGGG